MKWINVANKKNHNQIATQSVKPCFEMKSSVLIVLILVVLKVKSVRTTIISNVNFAFEVFSPKSMIRFFEFNDSAWNISQDCGRSMYSYLDGLQKDLKWAYKCKLDKRNFGGRKCRK